MVISRHPKGIPDGRTGWEEGLHITRLVHKLVPGITFDLLGDLAIFLNEFIMDSLLLPSAELHTGTDASDSR